jgi:hypothetical protein
MPVRAGARSVAATPDPRRQPMRATKPRVLSTA